MGEVIQLFRNQPEPDEPWDAAEVLTEAVQEDIVGVAYMIEQLWHATSEGEFVTEMEEIKERVKGWPTG